MHVFLSAVAVTAVPQTDTPTKILLNAFLSFFCICVLIQIWQMAQEKLVLNNNVGTKRDIHVLG